MCAQITREDKLTCQRGYLIKYFITHFFFNVLNTKTAVIQFKLYGYISYTNRNDDKSKHI